MRRYELRHWGPFVKSSCLRQGNPTAAEVVEVGNPESDVGGTNRPGQEAPELTRSVDDVINGSLFHLPLSGIPIVARQGEAMPILVVQLRMIRAVVITGPPRFRPEQGVLRHAFRGQDAVL